jgi:hypothetical protein
MVLALILIRQKTNRTLQIILCKWVVPEKIHTSPPPTEEISAVRRGRGEKIVSDNSTEFQMQPFKPGNPTFSKFPI